METRGIIQGRKITAAQDDDYFLRITSPSLAGAGLYKTSVVISGQVLEVDAMVRVKDALAQAVAEDASAASRVESAEKTTKTAGEHEINAAYWRRMNAATEGTSEDLPKH